MSGVNRRSLIALVTGVASAGVAGLKPKDVLASASSLGAGVPLGNGFDNVQVTFPDSLAGAEVGGYAPNRWLQRKLQLRGELDRRMDDLRYRTAHFPPHISTKKSWSESFKHSEYQKEYRELQRAYQALDDDSVAEVIIEKLFGIKP